MIPPDLVILGPPLSPSLAGQSRCHGRRLGWGERYRGGLGGARRTARIMHRRGRGDAWGMDPRQLRSMCRKHLGQDVREIVQQMKAVGHLAGRGCPGARGFGVGLRTIAHHDFNPGLGLKPCGDSGGFPIGEEGQGASPGEVQQEGAVSVALPQREVVHAEHPWGTARGAGGAADHPQQGIPADDEAQRPTQPHGPPGPRRDNIRQALGEDAAGACRLAAEQLADAELPCDPVATPREVGYCPGVPTVDVSGWGMTGWAPGCRLYGRNQQGDLGLWFIDTASIEVKQCGLRQQTGQRVSNLPKG